MPRSHQKYHGNGFTGAAAITPLSVRFFSRVNDTRYHAIYALITLTKMITVKNGRVKTTTTTAHIASYCV